MASSRISASSSAAVSFDPAVRHPALQQIFQEQQEGGIYVDVVSGEPLFSQK